MCSLIDFHTGEDRLHEVQAAKAAARRRAVRTQRENEFELDLAAATASTRWRAASTSSMRPHESRRASFRDGVCTQDPLRAAHRLEHLGEPLREVRRREAYREVRHRTALCRTQISRRFSTLSTRRLLDGVAVWVLHHSIRSSRPLTPDSPVDFRTGAARHREAHHLALRAERLREVPRREARARRRNSTSA